MRRPEREGEASRSMNLGDGKRRNIQRELDFSAPGAGEARDPGGKETESAPAAHEIESPAGGERLMEEICEWKNMKEAEHQAWANKGSGGVDQRGVKQRPDYRELVM